MADEKARPLRRRSPVKTILQLVVASIFVGAILALLDISPFGFWRGVFHSVEEALGIIGDSFGEIVRKLATYLVLGAAIVLPIWIVMRLLRIGRSRS
ncbi:MAG TPA: DUF6460 domain-containing protein [Parvularculaceae bacterium]|nr:DUF6460 domain-containing protein [Parvularculaceae bacterium]